MPFVADFLQYDDEQEPDPDQHQNEIRIRIRIKVEILIRICINAIRIRNTDMINSILRNFS
jgi:hypothetical protein